MEKLIAFHGKQEIKDKYVGRVKAHAEADEIIHGKYWENGKGCAVGCTIHSENHSAYEDELGLPTWLARIEDGIFEGQQNGDSKTFPLRFLEAIPVGADTELVRLPFLAWLMDDPKFGLAYLTKDEEIKGLALEIAAKLHAGETSGLTADDLTNRLQAARDAWDAFVKASADELLRLLGELKPNP